MPLHLAYIVAVGLSQTIALAHGVINTLMYEAEAIQKLLVLCIIITLAMRFFYRGDNIF